jgi:hypothetical protein
MSGYTRQSTADIIPTAVVRAAPINAEFNALRDAFDFDATGVTGHKHDGSADQGSYVPLIADIDGKNKVVIDTSNNRVGVFVEVSTVATEQVRFQDGLIVPVTDNDVDLGSAALEFKNLYLDGIAKIDTLTVDENATVAGTLGVTGATTLNSSLAVQGNVTLGDAVTDTVTYNARSVTNFLPNADATYDLGSASLEWNNLWLDGTANVDTLQVDESATISGSLSVSGNTSTTGNNTIGGNLSVNGNTTLGNAATDTVTITADVASNIIPSADSTYTLGDSGNYWSHGYLDAVTTTGNVVVGGALSVASTLDMTNGQINNVATPSLSSDAATKGYTDTQDALKLSLTGGTMSGAIAMGDSKITGLATPTDTADAATKGYVDATVSAVIDAAPGALDTLNELAAALGDDPNFSTTITNSIATKLPLAGGTMTGDITLGANKATSTATPTTDDTLTRKGYVDTQDALKLSLSGGTMSGNIAMGGNTVTGLATPVNTSDAVTKGYTDTLFGDVADAAASAAAAEAAYDSFDDRYLGAKATPPATDNDGDALLVGALYFDTTANLMKVYDGSSWVDAGSAVNGTAERSVYTATGGQTTFSATYDVGFVDVYLNGVKLVVGTDFTATNGTSVVLATGATAGDSVDIVAYGAFSVADTYTQAAADARFLRVTNNLSDLGDAATARQNLGVEIGVDVQAYDADTAKLDVAQTFTADQTVTAEFIATSYNETYVAVTSTSNATTVDCEAGNTFSHTLTENTTFTFANPPATGTGYTMTIEIIQDSGASGYTVTWPTSVDFPAATAPTLTATASAVDVFVFTTRDGGTNWYGFTAGLGLATPA